MAKFILDGQEYGGGSSGGSKVVKLTQAEYNALPNDKLSDDNIYLITDAGELSADNISYDGSETGLGNNVQEAIDELNSNLYNLSTSIVFELVNAGKYTCSASTKSTFRISLTKSGYTPVIIGAITGLPSNVTVESTTLSGNTLTMIVQNSNTSTTTINSLGIYVLYVRI